MKKNVVVQMLKHVQVYAFWKVILGESATSSTSHIRISQPMMCLAMSQFSDAANRCLLFSCEFLELLLQTADVFHPILAANRSHHRPPFPAAISPHLRIHDQVRAHLRSSGEFHGFQIWILQKQLEIASTGIRITNSCKHAIRYVILYIICI